jgi:hypothetical protein
MKNSMSFEDGVVEQKVQNAINLLSDKLDRELLGLRNNFEKNLANSHSEQALNLVTRMEQLSKQLQDQIKLTVSSESQTRKSENLILEDKIKDYVESIYGRVRGEFNREISELSEKLHKNDDLNAGL